VRSLVPLLSEDQIRRLHERARDVVEYRKSGLSLNHIQGCPLGCAYCIRHTYGLWDQDLPRALMTDADAVEQLVSHRYFQPDITPIQLFNRATDPFLPVVRPHIFAVLDDQRRGENDLRAAPRTAAGCRRSSISIEVWDAEPYPSDQLSAEADRHQLRGGVLVWTLTRSGLPLQNGRTGGATGLRNRSCFVLVRIIASWAVITVGFVHYSGGKQ